MPTDNIGQLRQALALVLFHQPQNLSSVTISHKSLGQSNDFGLVSEEALASAPSALRSKRFGFRPFLYPVGLQQLADAVVIRGGQTMERMAKNVLSHITRGADGDLIDKAEVISTFGLCAAARVRPAGRRTTRRPRDPLRGKPCPGGIARHSLRRSRGCCNSSGSLSRCAALRLAGQIAGPRIVIVPARGSS